MSDVFVGYLCHIHYNEQQVPPGLWKAALEDLQVGDGPDGRTRTRVLGGLPGQESERSFHFSGSALRF